MGLHNSFIIIYATSYAKNQASFSIRRSVSIKKREGFGLQTRKRHSFRTVLLQYADETNDGKNEKR